MHLVSLLMIMMMFALGDAGKIPAANAAEPILPLPERVPEIDSAKASLGGRLFQDPRLSKNGAVSCASCHDLSRGGVDGRERSVGIDGAIGDVNAPTVFNSGFNFRQFWNGRAKTLEEQIDGPIQHPKEMGANWDELLAKLRADESYVRDFSRAYGAITRENVKDAIASFERALVTANSRFDRHLRGDEKALTRQEKDGYRLFKSYGCVACHQGVNVGGNMFQTMGVMGDYFKDRGSAVTEADLGRFALTKAEADKHVFRVPSLRNIASTAPYFHDGTAKTLEEAIRVMAKYQLGRKLTPSEVDAIAAFLRTLTGETPDILRSKGGGT